MKKPAPPPLRRGKPPPLPPRKKGGAKLPSRPPALPPVIGEERREHERYELLAQVQVSKQAAVYVLSTANISRGGFFLCADPEAGFEVEVGVVVDVLLFSPDDIGRDISARARVMRHVEGEGDCVQGYGLRFETFRDGDLTHFEELLKLLER